MNDLPELAVDQLQVQHEGNLSRAFRRSVRVNFFAEIASQTVRVGGFVYLARRLASADAVYGLTGAHALPLVAMPPATLFLLFQILTVRNLLGDLLAPRHTQFAAKSGQFSKNAGKAA